MNQADQDREEKIVKKVDRRDHDQIKADLAYWLAKSPAERLEAVEILRRQRDGDPGRLQRVVKVIRRASVDEGITNDNPDSGFHKVRK